MFTYLASSLLFPTLFCLSPCLFILMSKTIEVDQIILPTHVFKMVKKITLHAKCSSYFTDAQTYLPNTHALLATIILASVKKPQSDRTLPKIVCL